MSSEFLAQAKAAPAPELAQERLVEEYQSRYSSLSSVIALIGFSNTLKVIFDRKVTHAASIIKVGPIPETFEFPVQLETIGTDLSILREIASQRVYQIPAEMGTSLNRGEIVDIGANIGMAAVYFATRYPESKITAMEPYDRNYQLLELNSQPYCDRINSMQAAIAPIESPVHPLLMETDSPTNYSSIQFVNGFGGLYNRTKVITPQQLAREVRSPEGIGLLKVDIEGAEKAVFESRGIKDLLDITRVLAVETHDKFEPGSTTAVRQAAAFSGLQEQRIDNGHTLFFARN